MTKSGRGAQQSKNVMIGSVPSLNLAKLGIVSRDYQCKYDNGYRDFSYTLAEVLKLMDAQGCDAVLFSLFSIIPRNMYSPITTFKGLKNVKAVLLEEFQDGKSRKAEQLCHLPSYAQEVGRIRVFPSIWHHNWNTPAGH